MSNKKFMMPLVVLLGCGIVGYFGYDNYLYVHSDNAQIEGRTLMVASKISGYITSVKVDVGASAKAGDVLAKIDDRDYVNAMERAKGDLESTDVRLEDAQKTYGRLASLVSKGASTQAQLDTALATLNDLKARQRSMKAQVAQAELNVASTEIRAPYDGYIAKRSVELGQFVTTAAPLFGFVDAHERWVTANLKETEIAGIAAGSKVDIQVDAVPNRSFLGAVENLSPSTGAAFTLIPPDNATGNFTKVVQRVPVRIALNGVSEEDLKLLRAGLSVDVRVHRR